MRRGSVPFDGGAKPADHVRLRSVLGERAALKRMRLAVQDYGDFGVVGFGPKLSGGNLAVSVVIGRKFKSPWRMAASRGHSRATPLHDESRRIVVGVSAFIRVRKNQPCTAEADFNGVDKLGNSKDALLVNNAKAEARAVEAQYRERTLCFVLAFRGIA